METHLTAKRYGRWTLLAKPKAGKVLARCRCGRTKRKVDLRSLVRGKSRQCQKCAADHARNVRPRMLPHLSRKVVQRLIVCAHGAIRRCTDETHKNWHNYGGRGLRVWYPWMRNRRLFVAYLATLKDCDDPKKIIDRIENGIGYRPGNLRFVTRKVSEANKRLKERR